MTRAARKSAPQDAAPAAKTVVSPDFAPRSIQRFADRDGTTMVVVAVDGSLHKSPAPPKEQDDEQA